MRIFVTGIDGFVGRHLARRLASEGHAVTGTSLTAGREVEGAGEVVACDVRDAERVRKVVARLRPEALVHLAGQTSNAAAFADAAETFRVNALGALNVLEACHAADIGRVLLVSSSEVYGARRPEEGPVDETAPLAPITPYGASKAAQDLLGYQYGHGLGLPVIRVRAFAHTGPGQDPRFVFPSVARRVARAEAGRGPAAIRVGWLGAVRDLSDVRDVVRAYEALLEHGEPGEAYNVCRGEGRTIGEALEALLAEARVAIQLERDDERLRPSDVEWTVGDPSRLVEATGWRPEYRWEETARDLLEEWRARVATEEDVE